ncbi:adenosylcobalamin-dependent ribonucleoside-diphosphate reductase [Sinomicrobium weinanense]|uniref:Vitamin B12-dependent ribonucleotide reductase n=1 Tax=Sinomicrobium weinanense TaxID=2842200 RepID=A0A926JQU0_9FLAO|nr:adenosylcobalamin-dependent ribonucleoside-diphosphate reductase [Sinomicrobium weinanense]MBC9795797.1 adenosylcobalamin-dependent ribonucleoside-diphosphate reductase [Sinomicrobium weinanense]MBU3121841.1 adenosylcobalamin-dependent ribonucleoside-diphosphate reductase [Sinomicrobium weinanense]
MVRLSLTPNALQILEERYLLRDPDGKVMETPEEMFRRVSEWIAGTERNNREYWEARFFRMMNNLEFLPNSPTLMNAGLPGGQLSACFVLPVEDSLDAIFTSLKNAALIHQSGGGTGYNFSRLRPKGALVSTSKGFSSGPVAFMKIYDAATEHVKQGGKRRGANMGILNVDHPDIEEFISVKTDRVSLRNFNISVGITDRFMAAVEKDLSWGLKDPRTGRAVRNIPAKKLWDQITGTAWATGDPGLIFLDSINRDNPTPGLGEIRSTNPCGEVPLLDYESCNLGSVNLSKMVTAHGGNYEIDFNRLAETVHAAIRFLDNVIHANHYLLPQIKSISLKNRKIGLGLMGWAELLMLMEIPYASTGAVKLAEKLMAFVRKESYKASASLAEERGCFPSWTESRFYPDQKMRNATCNSIAPTGTISVIADTSYSIEPLYALAYRRVGILGGKSQQELNKVFKTKISRMGYWSEHLENTVLQTGSIQKIQGIPEQVKNIFKTSLDIPWEFHLQHQRAFQTFTDNSVSKTINLPAEAGAGDISDVYMTAWKYGLKGITIYRDGSKEKQVLQRCNVSAPGAC